MRFISVIFLFFSLFSFLQTDNHNYKFVYKVSAKLDLENESLQINESMSLYVGKQKSLYTSDVLLKIDSARFAIKKRRGSFYEIGEFRKKLPQNKILSSIKKDYQNKSLTYTRTVLPNKSLLFK
jgi:GLPGLI family protein